MVRYRFIPVLFFSLVVAGDALATGYDSLSKTASIVHFRVRYGEIGIADTILTEPIHKQLTRIFRLNEVIDLDEQSVIWVGDYGKLPSRRKLKAADIEKVNAQAPRSDLIVSVSIDHEYNNILGGLLGGRRHVLWVQCSVFDRNGKLIWKVKKKDSCCASLSFSGNSDEVQEDVLAQGSFLDMYYTIVAKAFADK